MLTLTQCLEQIHRTYEGNVDYPTSSEDDYTVRVGYIQDAINLWGRTENVTWKELTATWTDEYDGDGTRSLPTDFVQFLTSPYLGGLEYPIVKAVDVPHIEDTHLYERYSYISGSTIVLCPTPDSQFVGQNITATYLKKANTTLSGSTVLEMKMPEFVIYYTLARLYELDTRNDLVTYYESKAKNIMDQMVTLNDAPTFNDSYALRDLQVENGFVLGE